MKRKEFRDDRSKQMGCSKRIRCEQTRVDGLKGHVALNWSLCGLQEIPNGNNLCVMNNPSL